MTIIALFVGLTEIGFGIVIANTSENLQPFFLWFVVLFPILCGLGFFLVLYFRPQNFYSPLDFRSDETYLAMQKQRTDLTEVAKYIQEKEIKNAQETPNTQSTPVSTIDSLSRDTCFYLLKVANQSLSMSQHLNIMKHELPAFLLEAITEPLREVLKTQELFKPLISTLSSIAEADFISGFLAGLWLNLDNLTIQTELQADKNLIVRVSPDILKQLGEKIGKSIA